MNCMWNQSAVVDKDWSLLLCSSSNDISSSESNSAYFRFLLLQTSSSTSFGSWMTIAIDRLRCANDSLCDYLNCSESIPASNSSSYLCLSITSSLTFNLSMRATSSFYDVSVNSSLIRLSSKILALSWFVFASSSYRVSRTFSYSPEWIFCKFVISDFLSSICEISLLSTVLSSWVASFYTSAVSFSSFCLPL